ncbi:T9SS type A sorting domain-containing protein [Viscerimonas tarda]
MKKTLLKLAVALCFAFGVNNVSAQQLAFPGAEGFGRNATGARAVASPTVYHVTNLNDSGTGSFRDAVSQPGRIVVFDVAGVIKLNSRIVFSGNSYIAGQTAPGDGVILYGDGVSFSGANNLIVRYLRVYMGKSGSSGKDASGIANGSNMIFDHLSLMWGLDENFSINWDSKGTEPADITIQNSIIGQGIMTHSAGGLIQTDGGVSILGCLYVDNKTRNPKVKGLNQFINNVVYNWGGSDGYIMGDSGGDSWVWLEGNYFIGGPSSSGGPFTRTNANFQLYYNNDYVDTNKDGTANGSVAINSNYGNTTSFKASVTDFVRIPKPHPAITTILTPQEALAKVIASVGASLPARSAPDAYVVDQLLSYGKKGALITNENNNGIYQNVGVVSNGPKLTDTDNDGIPDEWETANGLNPDLKADATQPAGNGYLNIENYINGISAAISPYVRCASDLKLKSRSITSITLEWKNNAEESDGILLQQSADGKAFETIQPLGATATSAEVSGLSEETTYYFRLVTKKSGLADSTPSEILKAATEGTPKAPYASTDPSPEVGSASRFYTEVAFAWENATGPWAGAVSYDVYFGASADALTKIASGISDKNYIYTTSDLTMGTAYYWRVDATNILGTTEGAVWNFKTGTYSFTSTLVDVGKDFTGSVVTAKSGKILASGTKTYTVFPSTVNEMKFSVSGGAVAESDGSYTGKGTTKIQYFDLTDNAHYVEATLTTASAEKNIASIKINGTSSDVDTEISPAVLFSDKLPFNTTSIIGYEEISLPQARKGAIGTEVTAPVGSKSFRLYRTVTISTVDEDLYKIGSGANTTTVGSSSKNPRVAYVSATLELLSNDAVASDIEAETANEEAGITYIDGIINNPKQETVLLYNTTGTLILTSDNSYINAKSIPSGLYIVKTETGKTLKFIK